jgi:hypothetical protein
LKAYKITKDLRSCRDRTHHGGDLRRHQNSVKGKLGRA